MARRLKVLALEPWHGGSHRDFLEGLVNHSRHEVIPFTLPGRFWKWRQTGSGLVLAERVLAAQPDFDLIFASDFLHLPDFLGMIRHRWPRVPAILYFHENQLTYPVQAVHRLDRAYPLANISGAAVADRVLFNSPYHQRQFLSALGEFVEASPDHPPREVAHLIQKKSSVAPLGVDLSFLAPAAARPRTGPLTILWNHRWEHDKNPDEVFAVLIDLARAGHRFKLVVCGQQFRTHPRIFERLKERLDDRILHWGFEPDRRRYRELLSRADVVVSLAHHDFFGVSVVEAMAAGCLPILADRLNYPELVPTAAHDRCLVAGGPELAARLTYLSHNPDAARGQNVRDWVMRFDWPNAVDAFDAAFVEVARGHGV